MDIELTNGFYRAQFSLAPTELITIRSNITYNTFTTDQINGSLTVSMNKDSRGDKVEFTLEMGYTSQQLRQRTNVCFSPTGSNRGLSIYVRAVYKK